jgi:chromosome segregation ATPase
LEISEVKRQTLEYDLTLIQQQLNKEKQTSIESERTIEMIKKEFKTEMNNKIKEIANMSTHLNEASTNVTKSEKEKQKLLKIINEQENVINTIKDQNDNRNKMIENFEKDQKNLLNKIKSLEDVKKEKEKLELKLNSVEKASTLDDTKQVEMKKNYENLMLKYKDLCKKTSDEQAKHFEKEETFKKSEHVLKMKNIELDNKLNEKIEIISKLSDQLNNYETDLIDIKNELNQTKHKQQQQDATLDKSIKELNKLNESILKRDCDFEKKFQVKKPKILNNNKTDNDNSIIQLDTSLSSLILTIDEFLKYGSPIRYSKEMETLRNERHSSEIAINSLKNEIDHLKECYESEIKSNDALTAQMNQILKTKKVSEQVT